MTRIHRISLTPHDSDPIGLSFDQADAASWVAPLPAYARGAAYRIGDTVVEAERVNAAAHAPVITAATLMQALYLQEVGTTSLISVSDINQGQIGDCFLLSSIGELALWHPSAIRSMITANADGTETVTLYLAANGLLPGYGTTTFATTSVTINNTFPSNAVNNGASQDVLNGQKEIWVQVLEKAVATLEGGYSAISNGGNPMIALEELTGQPATSMSPASLTLPQLQAFMAAGDLIVMDTAEYGYLPYGLVNCHAYMFESLSLVNGTAMVQLGNPWGFDQPFAIPLSLLSVGIVEVDIGRFTAGNAVTGGPGNDTITLPNAVTNASIDLGTGNDTLTFADGTNSATVANTETIIGGAGTDTIILATPTASASIDLGAGNDTLRLTNGTNSATIANIETAIGGTGNDTITLATAGAAASIDLGAGSDRLTLANGTNSATIANIETTIGGTGSDTITLATASANASIDLGAGKDTLALANATNLATIANTETIIAGTGNDTITLATPAANASIDLGAGSDRLILTNGMNVATIANIEAITGGTGNEFITLATAAANTSIDLGAGSDKLTMANATNTATISNVETLIGGSGNDALTLGTALTTATSVDLGAGGNKLTLANTRNFGTVSNVATLIGGSDTDSIVFGSAEVNGSADLGAGNDTLTLANLTNRVTVANTETVFGGSGNDTIVLQGTVASTLVGGGGMNFITGNSGADRFVFDQNSRSNTTTVMNFNAAKGDVIALDTTGSNILTSNPYDLGGAPLVLNSDLADVANTASRLSTNLTNGGKGAFLYEQDTGELFYSRNGSFAGGGTLVGAITTNGVTPWTFNASSFTQV